MRPRASGRTHQGTAPILITENGWAGDDDRRRCGFVTRGGALHAAIADVDVRCYFYWSLLDNYKWTGGYGPKFAHALARAAQLVKQTLLGLVQLQSPRPISATRSPRAGESPWLAREI